MQRVDGPMTNEIPQTQEELQEHLADHIQFLKSSADSFDAGFTGESKRMATSLRVLLHDTTKSHSLLSQLSLKSIPFYDSAIPINPRNKASHSGLVGALIGPSGGKPIPFLDNAPEGYRQIEFEAWWNAPIFVDSKRQVFTRRDLILTVADQDGGAHVDPALEESYAQLSRHNSMGWFYTDGAANTPIKEFERAAIRQITHEILKTLIPGYAKALPNLTNDEFMISHVEDVVAPNGPVGRNSDVIPTNRRIGRNETCPCGSGIKYKMCHGRIDQINRTRGKLKKRR